MHIDICRSQLVTELLISLILIAKYFINLTKWRKKLWQMCIKFDSLFEVLFESSKKISNHFIKK